MLKFSWNRIKDLLPLKKNDKPEGSNASPELVKVQKNIVTQASLALLTIVLTVVILFAVTSAWQTNIAQSSGLTFRVEPWGVDENSVFVDDTPMMISPGDEGIISLSVKNDSEGISEVSVAVSKKELSEEMKKRLFFYVDTPMEVVTGTDKNGSETTETVERVYVSDSESYAYTVFGKNTLNLTAEYSNAPQLKWEWVYDVLGYYVIGTEDAETGIVTVSEYIRPIEYDFDKATINFVVGEDGNKTVNIMTVDGEKTPDKFMTEISANDGFPGTVDSSYKTADGYYPISVDENGSGVYAYLCSYSEIIMATEWDTETGQVAYRAANLSQGETLNEYENERISHTAAVEISAENMIIESESVGTEAELNAAILDGEEYITLSGDITAKNGIEISGDVMIDLGGKTITLGGAGITAEEGSSLTLIDGTVKGNESTANILYAEGAELVLSGVTLSGEASTAIRIMDNGEDISSDSSVYLTDCNVNTKMGIFVHGNNDTDRNTAIVVENSEITASTYCICGNGDNGNTDISIIESTLKNTPDTYAAIYNPQDDSRLYIFDSIVSGYTGIAIKGGSVEIVDSTISGTGTSSATPAYSGSGFSDTADAVYIETNYGYRISLEITNSTLTSVAGQSLRVYLDDENTEVVIHSGIFDEEQNELYLAEGSEQVQSDNNYKVTAAAEEESAE